MRIVSPPITGPEIEDLQKPLQEDLRAAFSIMFEAAIDLLDQAGNEGWTADELIARLDGLFDTGPAPKEGTVNKWDDGIEPPTVAKGYNRIADSAEPPIDAEELRIGTIHEMNEHGLDLRMGVKIAFDHLKEHPDYYTRLKAMGLL
jgi:hypothetical protein